MYLVSDSSPGIMEGRAFLGTLALLGPVPPVPRACETWVNPTKVSPAWSLAYSMADFLSTQIHRGRLSKPLSPKPPSPKPPSTTSAVSSAFLSSANSIAVSPRTLASHASSPRLLRYRVRDINVDLCKLFITLGRRCQLRQSSNELTIPS